MIYNILKINIINLFKYYHSNFVAVCLPTFDIYFILSSGLIWSGLLNYIFGNNLLFSFLIEDLVFILFLTVNPGITNYFFSICANPTVLKPYNLFFITSIYLPELLKLFGCTGGATFFLFGKVDSNSFNCLTNPGLGQVTILLSLQKL